MSAPATHTDHLGAHLSIGDEVCWNWKNANLPKRTGRIIAFVGSDLVVTDAMSAAKRTSELLRCV